LQLAVNITPPASFTDEATVSQEPRRSKLLDGWRGVLALWVVLGHIDHLVGLHLPVLRAPGYAVDGFIVLSGYFIHGSFRSFARRHNRHTAILSFWRQRALRIWPAYLVVLLPSFALFAVFGLNKNDWTGLDLLAHATLLNGLVPAMVSTGPIPSWSLSLEMQFYILYPVIYYSGTSRTALVAVTALLLAAISPLLLGNFGEPGSFAHFGLPSALPYRLFYFLVGVAWREEATTGVTIPRLMILAVSILSLAGGIVIATMYLSAQPWARRMFALILESEPAQLLGRTSYSLYICHAPILTIFWWRLSEPGMPFDSPIANYGALAGCALPAIATLTWLVHRQVELRFLTGKSIAV
jgi:peptidoglycan/LPS O-acetylase OafA/YrhL